MEEIILGLICCQPDKVPCGFDFPVPADRNHLTAMRKHFIFVHQIFLNIFERSAVMPTYEFRCDKCGNPFTLFITLSEYEKDNFRCPKCKSKKVKQQISSFEAVTSKKS
jgi:putative FmdB family regulatory protein